MRSNASPDEVVAGLAACSLEAAWIALVYVLVGSLAAGDPGPLSMIVFAGAVLVGLGFARWAAQDEQRPYRTPLAVLVVAAMVIGWLVPLGLAAGRVVESPMGALEMHPGGILLGLAVVRGTAHVTPDDDERIAEIALGPGLAAIAVIWVVLTLSGGGQQQATLDAAFAATVTFVAAGLLSMGLARSVGLRDSGTVGAEHRTWVGVFVAVLAGMLAVAIPLALVAGVPVDEAIRGTLGPVGDVLVPLVSLVILPMALLGSLLVWMIGVLRPSGGPQPEPPGGAIGPTVIDWQKALGPSASETAILGLVPIVVALAGAFLLVRRFLGRPGSSDVGRDVTEIRENERPTGGIRLRLPRLPAPRRRHVPHTASEAYLASLDVLAASPELARLDEETPSEHARRVRADAIGPSLSRLAADYVLVEFGRRTLAPSEHRRAVERWRRIRSMLDRRT